MLQLGVWQLLEHWGVRHYHELCYRCGGWRHTGTPSRVCILYVFTYYHWVLLEREGADVLDVDVIWSTMSRRASQRHDNHHAIASTPVLSSLYFHSSVSLLLLYMVCSIGTHSRRLTCGGDPRCADYWPLLTFFAQRKSCRRAAAGACVLGRSFYRRESYSLAFISHRS